MRFVLLALFLIQLSCQTGPTKVGDIHSPSDWNVDGFKLDRNTVVIDVRPAFDFSTFKIPGSVNIDWKEFSDRKSIGSLKSDLSSIAARLARLGVSPQTSVVVVGRGEDGAGEEGRVAWMLKYLGIVHVRIARVEFFKGQFIRQEAPTRENAKAWQPNVQTNFLVDATGFKNSAVKRNLLGEVKTYIIDVRTQGEYLRKVGLGDKYALPDIGAINIDWREFINDRGLPDREIAEKLKSIGVGEKDRILIISQHGVRSGLAAFVLSELGFTNVANFAGGWDELIASK